MGDLAYRRHLCTVEQYCSSEIARSVRLLSTLGFCDGVVRRDCKRHHTSPGSRSQPQAGALEQARRTWERDTLLPSAGAEASRYSTQSFCTKTQHRRLRERKGMFRNVTHVFHLPEQKQAGTVTSPSAQTHKDTADRKILNPTADHEDARPHPSSRNPRQQLFGCC